MRKLKIISAFVILTVLGSTVISLATEGPPITAKGCACANQPPLNTGKCVAQFDTGMVGFWYICHTAGSDEIKDCKGVILDCGGIE